VTLVRAAAEESHGTLLIISESAASEAQRLSEQGTPVAPCLLTPDLLRHLTTIDGATLLSPDGMCHGIGTIFDERATRSGDPGRGSRFNSAARYVQSEWPCLAIVVSEDGGIDFIPNLRPALRRSVIERAIAEINALKDTARISRVRYNTALDFLNQHRFYLRKTDCDVINPLVAFIDQALREQKKALLWMAREEFVPNPELNEELFYEKE
jgi:hypothetical protein